MIWHFYAFFHLWLDSGDIIRFLVGRKQLNRAKSLLWFCLEHLLFVLGWLILPNFPTRTTTKRHDGIRPQHIVSHCGFSFLCQRHESSFWVHTVKLWVLTPLVGFFRWLMQGIFGPYVLWPFDKKLIFWIVTRVSARDYTVHTRVLQSTPAYRGWSIQK